MHLSYACLTQFLIEVHSLVKSIIVAYTKPKAISFLQRTYVQLRTIDHKFSKHVSFREVDDLSGPTGRPISPVRAS